MGHPDRESVNLPLPLGREWDGKNFTLGGWDQMGVDMGLVLSMTCILCTPFGPFCPLPAPLPHPHGLGTGSL